MSNSVRANHVKSLMDRFGTVCFAGMDRRIDIIIDYQRKSLFEMFGRETIFGSCKVETYNSFVFESYCKFCSLERFFWIIMTNRTNNDS
jgi:hypothetical protein